MIYFYYFFIRIPKFVHTNAISQSISIIIVTCMEIFLIHTDCYIDLEQKRLKYLEGSEFLNDLKNYLAITN